MAATLLSRYKGLALPLLIVSCAAFLLRGYFFPSFQIMLGILVAPFVFRIRDKGSRSGRYFYISVLCTACYYFLSMKLFLFLGLGSFLFYSIESRFGTIGALPFLFLLCISPALHYTVNVFTFTLRLSLSSHAAGLLNAVGYAVECSGNYFTLPDGFTFNVDTACLGLNMFNTGLALATLLTGLMEKRSGRQLTVFQLGLIYVSCCGLLILANFLRILTIVFFRSLPGTLSHELIGMFAMIAYVAAPLYFLTRLVIRRYGKEPALQSQQAPFMTKRHLVFPLLAFALLFYSFTSVERTSKTLMRDVKLEQLHLPGFTKAKKEDGVMEYRKDSLLVYIKPAVRAFESDHPPVLCWQGAGFTVEQVAPLKLNGVTLLMAVIKKGQITRYTAWWYDNGAVKTTDQWAWRLSAGEPFRIVNLTTGSKEELLLHCRTFLAKRLF